MFRRSYQSSISVVSAVAILLSTPSAGYSQVDNSTQPLRGMTQATESISTIDQEILKKELELLKLNAQFRTHYMKPAKWKDRRLKLYDTAGGAIANAGDITLLSQFWRYWKNPGDGLAHKGRLEAGAIVVAVAYLTLGGLYAADGLYDVMSDYKGWRKGFDAKSMFKKARALKTDLDDLLQKRSKLAESSESSEERQLLSAEGRVLKDFEALSLIEFSRLYIDSRQRKAARDLTTLGTIAVCSTGAAGAFQVVNGVSNVNLKQVGGGGISFLISGSTLTAAPVLIHGGAAIHGKISSAKVEKALGDLQGKTIVELENDMAELARIAKNSPSTGAAELQSYDTVCKLLRERKEFLDSAARKRKREIIESFLTYGAIGGPQIAWGTMLTRAGYHFHANPVKAFRGIAQAATVNEVSWGLWMLGTTQKGIRNEIGNCKEGKRSVAQEPFAVENTKLVDLEKSIN